MALSRRACDGICKAGWVVLSLWLCASGAVALQADLSASAQAQVSRALYAAALTTAADAGVADARSAAQRRRIDALQRQLLTAFDRASSSKASVTALELQLAQAQNVFVQGLAERDRSYALAIAAFRGVVQDVAATPEGEQALRQFNAGDEAGALAVLDRLADAQQAARQLKLDIETAALRRRAATLALDARDRGRQPTQAVIARYEEITRLDPGVHQDWMDLARLYADALMLPAMRRALDRALETAGSDRERSAALDSLAELLEEQGDLVGAGKGFEQSAALVAPLDHGGRNAADKQRESIIRSRRLELFRAERGDGQARRLALEHGLDRLKVMAAADPKSAEVHRELAEGLFMLGAQLHEQGDVDASLVHFNEGFAIARRLIKAEPDAVKLQRLVGEGLAAFSRLQMARGDFDAARGSLRECDAIFEKLRQSDPAALLNLLTHGASRLLLAKLEKSQGRLAEAEAAAQQGLEGVSRVAARAPGLQKLQDWKWAAHTLLGDVQMAKGSLASAAGQFEAALELARRRASALPKDEGSRDSLATSLAHLSLLKQAQQDSGGALRFLQETLQVQRTSPDGGRVQSAADRQTLGMYVHRLGLMQEALGDTKAALRTFEEMVEIYADLRAADPGSSDLTRRLGIGQRKLAQMLQAQRNLSAAKSRYMQSVQTARRFLAVQPNSPHGEQDLMYALTGLGDVQAAMADKQAALSNYEEVMGLLMRWGEREPGSAAVQRDGLRVAFRVAAITEMENHWQGVVQVAETMLARGVLPPEDLKLLQAARTRIKGVAGR